MHKLLEYFFPKKSQWIDIAVSKYGTTYKLTQMRIVLNSNKKIFRTTKVVEHCTIDVDSIANKVASINSDAVEQKLWEHYNS